MEKYKCRFCNGKGTIYFILKCGAGESTCVICGGAKTIDWVRNATQTPLWTAIDFSTFVRRPVGINGNVYFEYVEGK